MWQTYLSIYLSRVNPDGGLEPLPYLTTTPAPIPTRAIPDSGFIITPWIKRTRDSFGERHC